jgi:SAM-dependent methyltransferase
MTSGAWWRLRIAAKIVLSRLPVSYGTWRRLSLFRHGDMENPAYATRVFDRHYRRLLEAAGTPPARVLELGPGDSLSTAVIARARGAERTVLVDAVAAARADLAPYRALADHLTAQHLPGPNLNGVSSVDELLERCGATYLTGGLDSLRRLPDASIDFAFSHAVLEHLRRSEFDAHMSELFRIVRPGGVMSHRIDLKDHLGGALNNLRFTDATWESPLFASSGFYTNRLRASEILQKMSAAGFDCQTVHEDRWPRPPIARSELTPAFRQLSDDDLCISGLDVVCVRKKGDA